MGGLYNASDDVEHLSICNGKCDSVVDTTNPICDGDDGDDEDDSDDEAPSLAGLVTAADDLSTLLAAVKAAGLVEALSGDGNFSVFAPNNAAFAALPEKDLAALLADKEQLKQVILYHVVASQVLSAELKSGEQTFETASGGALWVIKKSSNGVTNVTVANSDRSLRATVVRADNMANNGVAHVIDAVLLPPFPSIGMDDVASFPALPEDVAVWDDAGAIDWKSDYAITKTKLRAATSMEQLCTMVDDIAALATALSNMSSAIAFTSTKIADQLASQSRKADGVQEELDVRKNQLRTADQLIASMKIYADTELENKDFETSIKSAQLGISDSNITVGCENGKVVNITRPLYTYAATASTTTANSTVAPTTGKTGGADDGSSTRATLMTTQAPPTTTTTAKVDDVTLEQVRIDASGAQCFDGSDAYYYFKAAPTEEGKKNWVIYLPGGGWCTTDEECKRGAEESPSHYSSNSWGLTASFPKGSVLNPYSSAAIPHPIYPGGANLVYLRYCTADAYVFRRFAGVVIT